MNDPWQEIVNTLSGHPKVKSIPDSLTVATGNIWQRTEQRLAALSGVLEESGIAVPEDLLSRNKIGELTVYLKRSAGQTQRRKMEKEVAVEEVAEEEAG